MTTNATPSKAPELYTLCEIDWQYFLSLTFTSYEVKHRKDGSEYHVARRIPSPVMQQKMWFSLLRRLCRWTRTSESRVLWALRQERGELTQREHLHALIAGLPPNTINKQGCMSIVSHWLNIGGGFARCSVYDPELHGEGYITKCLDGGATPTLTGGAASYEVGKFGAECELRVSKSVYKVARSNQRRQRLRVTSVVTGDNERLRSRGAGVVRNSAHRKRNVEAMKDQGGEPVRPWRANAQRSSRPKHRCAASPPA